MGQKYWEDNVKPQLKAMGVENPIYDPIQAFVSLNQIYNTYNEVYKTFLVGVGRNRSEIERTLGYVDFDSGRFNPGEIERYE